MTTVQAADTVILRQLRAHGACSGGRVLGATATTTAGDVWIAARLHRAAQPAQIRIPRDLQFPSSTDTLVSFVGRTSCRCRASQPSAWNLRHTLFVRDGVPHATGDITEYAGRPRPSTAMTIRDGL